MDSLAPKMQATSPDTVSSNKFYYQKTINPHQYPVRHKTCRIDSRHVHNKRPRPMIRRPQAGVARDIVVDTFASCHYLNTALQAGFAADA